MTELFPESEMSMLSPRAQWLKDHGLTLRKTDNGKWECVLIPETTGIGATEDDACADFCLKTKLSHWTEEHP
jgi:hypothetical protein